MDLVRHERGEETRGRGPDRLQAEQEQEQEEEEEEERLISCVYVPNAHRHTRAQRHAAAVGGVEEGNSDAQKLQKACSELKCPAATSLHARRKQADHTAHHARPTRRTRSFVPCALPGRACIDPHLSCQLSPFCNIRVFIPNLFFFSSTSFFFLLPQVTLVGRLNKCLTDFLSSLTEKKNRIETRFTLVFFSHIKRQHIYFV